MKIIFSRKGFDQGTGGCASPIFEDGTFLSLPIPEKTSCTKYSEIGGQRSVGKIVEDLTGSRKQALKATHGVHLDPDLRFDMRPRKAGWRPLFGQAESAQGHLDKYGVGPGDIFLFFGWFRRVQIYEGRFRFMAKAPDLHMFFGWLEVGDVWRLWRDTNSLPDWATDHPHFGAAYRRNTVYVAAQNKSAYRAGTFSTYADSLVLTARNKSRSHWLLPIWFDPEQRKSALSYHRSSARWTRHEDHVELRSVGRGQEFILDADDYPEAVEWVRALIGEHGNHES